MSESNAYILDTDREELIRLGIQHEIWSEEAHRGWEVAGFRGGQTLLDLGCGPGYCSVEMAYRVGAAGKVVAVDRSESFIRHLDNMARQLQLNVETVCADFDKMILSYESLDGLYCRWALAWLPDPAAILARVIRALKPGATAVFHEYYDWSTHQVHPYREHLSRAIAAALASFKESDSEIDIGRQLPVILPPMGMTVVSTRLMAKLALPGNAVWQWPKTFYYSYLPRLVEMKRLTAGEAKQALQDVEDLEQVPGASICCPLMLEVVAQKTG